MTNAELYERIKQLGFSEYEAKCYLALFERESLGVSEVSRLAGVPRPNAYEAMEKLLIRGLCVSMPGKTKKYAVSDPWFLREKSLETLNHSMDVELENLEKRRQEILDRKKAIQENIDGLADELDSFYNKNRTNGSPLDFLEVLKEPYQILHKYMRLINQSARQIVVFSKPPYSFSTQKQQSEQEECVARALQRGVKIRSIYEMPADAEGMVRIADKVHIWSGKGEEMRVVDSLPIKLAVFDESIVMLPLEDSVQGKSSLTNLVAEHHDLAKGLMFLFESFWEKAQDFKTSDMAGEKRSDSEDR